MHIKRWETIPKLNWCWWGAAGVGARSWSWWWQTESYIFYVFIFFIFFWVSCLPFLSDILTIFLFFFLFQVLHGGLQMPWLVCLSLWSLLVASWSHLRHISFIFGLAVPHTDLLQENFYVAQQGQKMKESWCRWLQETTRRLQRDKHTNHGIWWPPCGTFKRKKQEKDKQLTQKRQAARSEKFAHSENK